MIELIRPLPLSYHGSKLMRVRWNARHITIDDILAYDIEQRRKLLTDPDAASRISIEGQTDTRVNLVDPATNQTVQTLPAREVVYGIPATFGDAIFVAYSLLVLADNGTGGYSIRGYTEENIELDEGMPAFVRQAFDSFELLAPSSTAASPLAQQQEVQNDISRNSTSGSSNSSTSSTTALDDLTAPLRNLFG